MFFPDGGNAMYAEITAALSSLKVAGELTALVLNTKVNQAVTQKAIELQSAIMSLQTAIIGIQSQNQELLEENNRLKQEIISMKNWEAEARKYSLKEIIAGVFVYAINEDQRGTEPGHWLCAHCYTNKQKSILQKGERLPGGGGDLYDCPNCKTHIIY